DFEEATGFVGDLQALDVKTPGVGRIRAYDDFAEEADALGQSGSEKEVKFAELEGVVDRRREGKNERIGVGAESQIEVCEAPNFQSGTAARELHSVLVSLGSVVLRGRSRQLGGGRGLCRWRRFSDFRGRRGRTSNRTFRRRYELVLRLE